jgi:hypothetical protein
MAQSIEEIKESFEAPTHKFVNGERVDLSDTEANDILDSWAEAERARQLDLEANGYKADRKAAYASIEEQLDMMYKDKINGTTTWEDHITEVKTDNPKPSE